eukprot:4493080-Heterocapsa_arctica.AAC.1
MLPTQDGPMQQWETELDHLQQQQVLQMQISSERGGEFRDQQLQGGDDQCHRKMVGAEVLERTMREGEDIVHSLLPGNKAKRETDPRK